MKPWVAIWFGIAALLIVALASCAAPPPQPPLPPPPPPAVSCPGRVVVPPAPKAPRTVEQVARWATAMDAALVRSERARAECEAAVRLLRRHIEEHR